MKKLILFLIVSSYNIYLNAQRIVGVGKEVDPYHYSSVKYVTYSKACVASAHPLASEVGAAIMKRGGNAFDAMIATQLACSCLSGCRKYWWRWFFNGKKK